MSRFLPRKSQLAVLGAILLAACQIGPQKQPPIGVAYVGPAVLKIRSDIPLESRVVATVKHGERLELLQRRRRFFRVRVPGGAEGWTDERQLLAQEDMDHLKELAARAMKMPAQGQATSFGELNVHTQPSRESPSFIQVKENEKMEVLTHVATPRVEGPRKPLLPPAPKKAKTVESKPVKPSKYPPLVPLPKPPGPPAGWLELSKTELPPDELQPPEEKKKEEKPPVLEDWSLVRTHGGEAGWVLTRRLVMAIPDEVAQYAEGRRIVSYFPLGAVQDGDQKKHNWLWTTIGSGVQPYDFDSFRVFIWNVRRHRYETAYIERNIHGYAPVLLKDVELTSSIGKTSTTNKYPGFSICAENHDGQRYRRDYAFVTNVVRRAGDGPCQSAAVETAQAQAALPAAPETEANESFLRRIQRRLRAIVRRRLGG